MICEFFVAPRMAVLLAAAKAGERVTHDMVAMAAHEQSQHEIREAGRGALGARSGTMGTRDSVQDGRATETAGKAFGEFIYNQRAGEFAQQRYTGGVAGEVLGGGLAQQARAPGKTFTLAEVLAVLKSQRIEARLVDRVKADAEYEGLIRIFAEME